MSFDKIKEFIVKNKEFFIFYTMLFAGILALSGILSSITNILLSNQQYKKELDYCASLLDTYIKHDDRMEKVIKNLENNMEKADALYDDIFKTINKKV